MFMKGVVDWVGKRESRSEARVDGIGLLAGGCGMVSCEEWRVRRGQGLVL